MTDSEYQASWPSICQEVKGITNLKELQNFIANELMAKPINMRECGSIRFHIVSEYMGNSVILFLGHHS